MTEIKNCTCEGTCTLIIGEPQHDGESCEEYLFRARRQFSLETLEAHENDEDDSQWQDGVQEELADLRRDQMLECQEREAFEWG